MIAEEAEKMSTDISRITFVNIDFDRMPEMFFSRGGYNIPIYRGFSYKSGKLIDIVILDEVEGMPAFLGLYRENSTQKLLWFAMNTLKDGLAYYDTISEELILAFLSNWSNSHEYASNATMIFIQ